MQPNQPSPTSAIQYEPITLPVPTQLMPSPRYELRPDSKTFWRGVGSRALILLPLIALGIYHAVQQNGVGGAVLLYVSLVVVLLVGVLIMLQTSSIVLTASTIEKHRLLLRPRVIQRAVIAQGVLVPQYTSTYNRTAPLLILVSAKGRSLLRLTGQVFKAGGLFTLAERIGLQHFDVISGVVGPKAVAKRHKKILPLFERRPALVVVLGTIVLLVLIVVGISIFDPVQG